MMSDYTLEERKRAEELWMQFNGAVSYQHCLELAVSENERL